MAPIKSVTVTLRMDTGELRAGLELRATTDQDALELEEMLALAKSSNLYNEETEILGWKGLYGKRLFWKGVGAKNRRDFENMPRNMFQGGKLWISDPWKYVEPEDDLTETCLCQEDASCKKCRLIKRVKNAESAQYDAQRERDAAVAELDTANVKLKQWEEMDDYYDNDEPAINQGGHDEEEQEIEENEQEENEQEENEKEENNEEDEEGDESEDQGFDRIGEGCAEGVDDDSVKARPSKRATGEKRSGETTELPDLRIRAKTAEAKNKQLLKEIVCLQHYNIHLRQKLKSKYKSSTAQAAPMAESTNRTFSASHISGRLQGNANHLTHGRGGKTRPKNTANTAAEVVAENTSQAKGKTARNNGANCDYAKVDAEQVTAKRLRDKHDNSNDEDEDLNPRSKRRRRILSASDKTARDGKGGQDTCGLEKQGKKRHQNDTDEDEDGEDEDLSPRSKRRRFIVSTSNKTARDRKGSQDTYGSEKLIKKRHQNDTDEDEDDEDYPGLSPQRGKLSQSRKHNPHSGRHGPKTTQNMAKTLGCKKKSTGTILDAVGPIKSRTLRATNNSLSGFMDDHADMQSPVVPQPSFSNTALSSAATAPAPSDNSQTGTGGGRAQGWSDAERQALISLVGAHRSQPLGPNGQRPVILHDIRLFNLMSRQLWTQHGINRTGGACKNEWNRRCREVSGIDNRRIPQPSRMATSLQ